MHVYSGSGTDDTVEENHPGANNGDCDFICSDTGDLRALCSQCLSLNTSLPTYNQFPRHRKLASSVTRAVHAAARLFCFGEERRKLSPQGEIL